MDLNDVKLGERYFGIINKYSHTFLTGVRIVEIEITKINKKTVGISFNRDTRKYPQLMPKKEIRTIYTSKEELLKDFMGWVEKDSKYPEYLKKRIMRYCKRKQ